MSIDKEILNRFKANLMHLLTISGMSQADLAKAMGVSIPHANRLINAKAVPTIKTLGRIAKALSMPPWFLIWAPLDREMYVYDFLSVKYGEKDLEVFLDSLSAFQRADFLAKSAPKKSIKKAKNR